MSFLLYIIGLALLIGGIGWALVAPPLPSAHRVIKCQILARHGGMMSV